MSTVIEKNMITNQELRELSRVDIWRSMQGICLDWFVIFLSFAAVIYFKSLWIDVLAFMVIARMQLGLAIMMHDGAHKRLAVSASSSDFIGQVFCAAPLFFSMYSYRVLHLKHHQNPLAEDDPDLGLIGGYPISRKSLTRKLLRDATGISYFKFIRYFIHMARKQKTSASKSDAQNKPLRDKVPLPLIVSSIVISNLFLFSALFTLGHPWLYLIFWFLPAVTFLQVLLRIRGIAEHAGFKENPDQRYNARTVLSSFQTLIFAPHEVNYHIEHHLYPSVPYYRLPDLHKILMSRNALPPENIYLDYGAVLKEIVH